MNMVYKGFGYLRNMYNQINPATLTGAIDILVVEQPDGTLLASPFHVRFGKLGVLRAKEKLVNITVNDERIRDLHMKLGDQGEAFFLEEILEEEDEVPPRLVTSPLPSRPSTPVENNDDSDDFTFRNYSPGNIPEEHNKRRRRKKRKRRSYIQQSPTAVSDEYHVSNESRKTSLDEDFYNNDNDSDCSENGRCKSQSSIDRQRCTNCSIPTVSISHCNSDIIKTDTTICQEWNSGKTQQLSMRCVLSDSELPNLSMMEMLPISPFSDSEVTESLSSPKMMWGWGQLPEGNETEQDSSSDDSTHIFPKDEESHDVNLTQYRRNSAPQHVVETSDNTASRDTDNRDSKTQKKSSGLYLDDVLNLAPSEADLYLHTYASSKTDKQVQSNSGVVERAISPLGSDIDSGTDCLAHEDHSSDTIRETSDITMSLCGFSSGCNVNQDKFSEKIVTFDKFVQNPTSVLTDPNLVLKVGCHYFNWQNAAPIILSLTIFKQSLPQEYISQLVQSQQPQQGSRLMGWLWRRPAKQGSETVDSASAPSAPFKHGIEEKSATLVTKSYSDEPPPMSKLNISRDRRQTENDLVEDEVAQILHPELKRSHSENEIYANGLNSSRLVTPDVSKANCSIGKTMRKTTRLTSEQLSSLHLKPGANTILFSVTTQYQGTTRCQATIYLWKWSDKIVVSDIDGTITKSDLFGQILPAMGKDWTQGGVAQLYQNIANNGYKFIYLSSRAIGQASMTKGYLNWINQQGVSLPPGPLLLSPTSLMIAFRREVIEKKPEKFKIECLKDIQFLFNTNPFVGGFGNKSNDVTAYTAVGIPIDRLFVINHKGELKHEQLQTYTNSYTGLGDMVDNFFPPLDRHDDFTHAHSYSDFTYWRQDVIVLSDELIDFKLF
ncbi:phosphatidate phosphatase LPIN1-like isoform X2 [Clavelina lepadiformis]|uniref:phosphatidate phosphatase LPIN1-like isoform X2 n=1 Tax=Clavelina lepadiformis TaxID=159417 RepID=UPI004041F549